MEIGSDEIVELEKTGGRQHEIGEPRAVGQERIDHDGEQIIAPQGAVQAALVRDRGGDVHVPDEQAAGFFRILQMPRQIHVADLGNRRCCQLRRREAAHVEAARRALAVQIVDARARLADIACRRRQQRAGPHDVAPLGLALQALAEPEQRRPLAVCVRGLFDQRCRHAGLRLGPCRIARRRQGRDLVPAQRMGVDEGAVDLPVADQHMQHAVGQRRIAAGAELEMQVGRFGRFGAHRIDDDLRAARFGQPVLVRMGGGGRGVDAPQQHAVGVLRRAWIEACDCGAQGQLQRHVAGLVAHRVGIGLGSAEPVEEALWEIVGDDRTGAGVVAVDDRRRAAIAHDVLQARRDGAERLVPGNRLELRFALGADAAQRREQALSRIAPDAVVGDGAFAAQRAAAYRMFGIAQHAAHRAVALHHHDAAGIVAVARTGRLYVLAIHGGSVRLSYDQQP